LSSGEILGQILAVNALLDGGLGDKRKITNVVLMGSGEPLDNYDNTLAFLRNVSAQNGINISPRNISLSTCGLVPKIKEFSDFDLQINLAISLHAPNNELRSKIMKINKVYPIEEVLAAVKDYIKKTNRRVTFEYILLKGVNDTKECALELARLLKGINAYVNLIPYNEVKTKSYRSTKHDEAESFFQVLYNQGINATVRMEHGNDISAACGQLRAQKMQEKRKV
jgi:23S rRNA (adenine2503-C2)-methyltransferase